MDDFWKQYQKDLNKGYFKSVNGKKALKPEFIVTYPEKIAGRLEDSRKNKLSQLWKFYFHAMRVQDRLCQSDDPLEIRKAELYELQPQACYALQRKTVTPEFRNFIDFNVQSIHDNEDLRAFIKHFQSVIAYLPRQNQK